MQNRTNQIAAGVGGLVALAALGWWLGWFAPGEDPQITELLQLRDEQMAKREELSPEDRQAQRASFGEKMKGLTDQQRQAFFQASAPIWMKMAEARMDQFLAMSPEEQKKELDRKIDEQLAREKNPQAGGGGPGGGWGGGKGGPPSPQRVDEFRKKMLDWTTPEQRAKFQSSMQMYQQRMKERGLEPKPGGGRFF